MCPQTLQVQTWQEPNRVRRESPLACAMRDETTKKVLDFPESTRVKEIQLFIGQVHSFRDHVYANHSELVRSLQAYMSQNKTNRK